MIVVYILAAVIITLLVTAALMQKFYSVEKTIINKKPATEVMKRVSELKPYCQWNPWQESDPTAKSTITGNPAANGH